MELGHFSGDLTTCILVPLDTCHTPCSAWLRHPACAGAATPKSPPVTPQGLCLTNGVCLASRQALYKTSA